MLCLKRFLLLFCLFGAACAGATGRDSLLVKAGQDGWSLRHRVVAGETVFSIARRYHVPPAILAEANGLTYSDQLAKDGLVTVPLGVYNILTQNPVNKDESRPLYYRVAAEDKLYRISRGAGVSQQALRDWNVLTPGEPPPGRVLLVGWVRYDATPVAGISAPQKPAPANVMVVHVDTPKYVLAPPPPPDTPAAAVKPGAAATREQLWNEQTTQGTNVITERGSAGFFAISGKAGGAAVYAFHNTAPRGTVIRVRNLNNDRVIYVKALGPLPQTKQYAGCVIGLSTSAKSALGIRETKSFCEMSYAGY